MDKLFSKLQKNLDRDEAIQRRLMDLDIPGMPTDEEAEEMYAELLDEWLLEETGSAGFDSSGGSGGGGHTNSNGGGSGGGLDAFIRGGKIDWQKVNHHRYNPDQIIIDMHNQIKGERQRDADLAQRLHYLKSTTFPSSPPGGPHSSQPPPSQRTPRSSNDNHHRGTMAPPSPPPSPEKGRTDGDPELKKKLDLHRNANGKYTTDGVQE